MIDQDIWDETAELRIQLARWLTQLSPTPILITEKFHVTKDSGDYTAHGVIVGLFPTPSDKLRIVVAHEVDRGDIMHIYSASNLSKRYE